MNSNHFFWAKLGNDIWPEMYHPVICHLIDVGAVSWELWCKCLRDREKQAIAHRIGFESVDDAGSWISFWVGVHDIGKITPCFQFQGKTEELRKRLTSEGYNTPIGNEHHTITGTKVLAEYLEQENACPKLDQQLARNVAVAVGGHHGRFPSNWNELGDVLGNSQWADARRKILHELARVFAIVDRPAPKLTPGGDQSVWMILAGLTSVADWIGSNVTFFPSFVSRDRLQETTFDINDYFANAKGKATAALKALGWLDRAEATGKVATFQEATGIAKPRPLQEKIIPLAEDMAKTGIPKLFIIESPMGEGKTEAAWYVADCWDRGGGAGTYVALPTIATSNQMFGRVAKFLKRSQEKGQLFPISCHRT